MSPSGASELRRMDHRSGRRDASGMRSRPPARTMRGAGFGTGGRTNDWCRARAHVTARAWARHSAAGSAAGSARRWARARLDARRRDSGSARCSALSRTPGSARCSALSSATRSPPPMRPGWARRLGAGDASTEVRQSARACGSAVRLGAWAAAVGSAVGSSVAAVGSAGRIGRLRGRLGRRLRGRLRRGSLGGFGVGRPSVPGSALVASGRSRGLRCRFRGGLRAGVGGRR